jgi:hypothetical protein
MRSTTVTLTIEGKNYWEISEAVDTQLQRLMDVPAEELPTHVESITIAVEEGDGGHVGDKKVVNTWVAEVTVRLRNLEEDPRNDRSNDR